MISAPPRMSTRFRCATSEYDGAVLPGFGGDGLVKDRVQCDVLHVVVDGKVILTLKTVRVKRSRQLPRLALGKLSDKVTERQELGDVGDDAALVVWLKGQRGLEQCRRVVPYVDVPSRIDAHHLGAIKQVIHEHHSRPTDFLHSPPVFVVELASHMWPHVWICQVPCRLWCDLASGRERNLPIRLWLPSGRTWWKLWGRARCGTSRREAAGRRRWSSRSTSPLSHLRWRV